MDPKGLRHRQLLSVVERAPGVSLADLSRMSLLDHSTVAYHARTLTKKGDVVAIRSGRELCLFRNGSGHCDWQRRIIPLLGARATRTVLGGLLDGPADCATLTQSFAVAPSSARWSLLQLETMGAVSRSRASWSISPDRRPCLVRSLLSLACNGCPARNQMNPAGPENFRRMAST